ncbi:MAG: hypothetical protein GEV07_22065 [Streptosporangiales bacterium]|nr:hypothetical protein [Streptosporangiales bacterium]
MRVLRLPVLAVLAAAALVAGTAGTALASPVSGSPARSCVVQLQPDSSARQSTACFDSLAAAVRHATADTVHIPPGSNTLTQTQLDGGNRSTTAKRSSRIIGIEYVDTDFRGASKVYNVNAAPCNAGGSYRDGDLSDDPFNDEISSARSYEGCTSTHYQHSGFGGWKRSCGCSSMGWMNDRTSSIRWS